MKHIIQLLLASIIMFGITACHTENDDYYSTVSIILSANDDITIEQMQGTITLRNTSNGQQYSSSSINRNSTTVYVLKGAYTLSAEGTTELLHPGRNSRWQTAHLIFQSI